MKIKELCNMIDGEKYSVIGQVDRIYEIVRSAVVELYEPIVSEPEIQKADDGRTIVVYEHHIVEGTRLFIVFAWDSNNIFVNYILGETNTVVARMVVTINGNDPFQTNLEQFVKLNSRVRDDIIVTNKAIANAMKHYMWVKSYGTDTNKTNDMNNERMGDENDTEGN